MKLLGGHFVVNDGSHVLCGECRRKEGAGVVIAGREAQVDLALGHDDARALSIAKAEERGHSHDNRRLGLAKEGHIVEGSPAWEDMSAGDQAKRKRAAGVRASRM